MTFRGEIFFSDGLSNFSHEFTKTYSCSFLMKAEIDKESSSSSDPSMKLPSIKYPLAAVVDTSCASSPAEEANPEALPVYADEKEEMEARVKAWKSVLLGSELDPGVVESKLMFESVRFPSNIFSVVLDQPNQRVIKHDCDRTRASLEEFKDGEVRAALEAILTHYCQTQNIKYKQGMNEVLAPFVYMKCLGAIRSWSECSAMYTSFISIFLPDLFADDEFHFLQRACVLFKTALRYHAPALSSRLDAAMVSPEMFVTPWFLTLFASKTTLPTIFSLWDHLIANGDKHSVIFVSISLCVSHARVLRSSSKSSLPETITKIAITPDSVVGLWKRSLKLRQHTPAYLIQQLANAAEFHTIDVLPAHMEKQCGETFPMLLPPRDLLRGQFLMLDCRGTGFGIGSLPLSIPFDLESLVTGQSIFPVADALKKVAGILGVDLAAPAWPVESHICLMGLSDSAVDAVGLFYVALSKFSNVPRVSILKGGIEAVHAQLPQELMDHEPGLCPLCRGLPIDEPQRVRGYSASSSSASSVSAFSKIKTFVSAKTSLLVGGTPPLPTSKALYFPSETTHKCTVMEVLGRSPSSDIEAHGLLVVGDEAIRCFAAPIDMTALTHKCELKMYGNWKVGDLVKVTSRKNQPAVLLLYFSLAPTPDLVVSLTNIEMARTAVDDVRRKYRNTRQL